MNKKSSYVLVVVVFVACLTAVGYLFERSRTVKPSIPSSQSQTTADPSSATYIIDGTRITLTNGAAERPAAPGSAEIVTTRIFGEPTYGDINRDGKNDAAVFLVQDGGGSGMFYYAAAAFSSSQGTIGSNAVFLGDRVAPDTLRVANGIVTVNYADRKAKDPMSTPPSIGVSKYLVAAGDALYDTPTDIYPLPSGFIWGEKQAAMLAPGDVNATSTLIGIKIQSQPMTDITDLTAKTLPFDSYYKKKLVAAGWTEDNSLAAGGPGAEITGYRKGNDSIILEYTSVFKNKGNNSPETCPCDLTFSIFAGTVEGAD